MAWVQIPKGPYLSNKEVVKQIQYAIQYIQELADPADAQAAKAMHKMLKGLYQAAMMISDPSTTHIRR